MKEARPSIARAIRSESFDENSVADVISRVETATDAARKAAIEAFAKIHTALDPKQRELLASWVESGPGAWGPFGGFR
jgi:Spy/CpxP family protein refolding chaperone